MKKVLIDEDNVSTLGELAEKLAKMYGWKSHEVEGDVIYFETDDGAKHRVDTSGFVKTLEDGVWVYDGELDIDWDEDFGEWSSHIWAEDEDGNTVMLHN